MHVCVKKKKEREREKKKRKKKRERKREMCTYEKKIIPKQNKIKIKYE